MPSAPRSTTRNLLLPRRTRSMPQPVEPPSASGIFKSEISNLKSDDSESGNRKLNTIERSMLEHEVVEAIRTVFDPEIPVNVYDLGLIYRVDSDDEGNVDIVMTLT